MDKLCPWAELGGHQVNRGPGRVVEDLLCARPNAHHNYPNSYVFMVVIRLYMRCIDAVGVQNGGVPSSGKC